MSNIIERLFIIPFELFAHFFWYILLIKTKNLAYYFFLEKAICAKWNCYWVIIWKLLFSREKKNLVGDVVYCGRGIFTGGWGMIKFSASGEGTPPHLPVGKTLNLAVNSCFLISNPHKYHICFKRDSSV